jgi:hypothetical protein
MVGSSSKEEPTVMKAPTVATRCPARDAREHVAQGSHFSLAAFLPRRGLGGAAQQNSDCRIGGAARTRVARKAAEPALSIAKGPECVPCATSQVPISFSRTPMSARPFAVGGRLAVPSVYIAAEPRSVARRSRNQLVARPSWPCRSRAGRPCHNVGAPLVGALASTVPKRRGGTRPAPTS